MEQRNDGQGEINALQNRFTSYLLVAIKHRKRDYIKKKARLEDYERLTDFHSSQFPDEPVYSMMDEAASFAEVEDLDLMRALSNLSERERYILFERIVNECEYARIAEHLNLRCGSIPTTYHRIIKKLRKELEGGRK